ncbi:MAG: helicase RepA family protein [Lachnospiraceae bacterium]|nr:helicase RepA family protein [Ruminococcus sp.]MCM1276653.1 helicase RepA family protein [Lachnospiraceae bacterium]
MAKLNTINCEELMTQPLKPIEFVVNNLITQGLFILAGAPKIGKSWLALDICLSVAKGEPVMNAATKQGTALYLCLEDSRIRIQNRLYEMTDEPTEHLHFALLANSIGSGLEEQIENFINEHRDTQIIFIDTLQKIRSDSPDCTYATDYKELSALKTIADKRSIAIVLVHHLRKTKDADPFNMISGTTGLSGCVDGSFVLSESKRGSRDATLYCVGRDIENREIELKFDSDRHRWISDENFFEKDNKNKIFIEKILDFISERKNFVGTATELAELLALRFDSEIFPNRLTRDLVQNTYELSGYGVKFVLERSHGVRRIRLELLSGDGSDSKNMPF